MRNNMSQHSTSTPAHFKYPALEAIIQISIASEHLKQLLDKAIEPLGINGGHYSILRILKRSYPEGLSRIDIVKQMIEKTSDTTRLIDGLEKKGFVERIRTSKDRRLSLTKITSDGMKKLEDIDPLFMDLLKNISSVLSEEECKQLSSLCKKLYSGS